MVILNVHSIVVLVGRNHAASPEILYESLCRSVMPIIISPISNPLAGNSLC